MGGRGDCIWLWKYILSMFNKSIEYIRLLRKNAPTVFSSYKVKRIKFIQQELVRLRQEWKADVDKRAQITARATELKIILAELERE